MSTEAGTMTDPEELGGTLALRTARSFAHRLGTPAYPVGARIAAVEAIRDECGVSDGTAYAALRHLQRWGRLSSHQGARSVVLAPPPPDQAAERAQVLADARAAHLALGRLIEQLAELE
jgi:DNA-binding GntR family transcriptional regulator